MDLQATFFATIIDEWARAGITDAVICPGNRSTLLSVLLNDEPRINVHVMADERSASFFGLGLAKATGRPALFWCTSGTATAQAHSAVIEASHARVPLLVCTSNRPPELHHVRDWQSIDQSRLYDGLTRWSFAPGVADRAMADSWRSIASRAVAETRHNPLGPGPVHLDLAIREPWTLDIGPLPEGRADGRPWHSSVFAFRSWTSVATGAREVSELDARRGIFVVGESDVNVDALYERAEQLGWPVFAEARSGARRNHPLCVSAYDTVLRNAKFASSNTSDVVVQIGTPSISKALEKWVGGTEVWHVDPFDTWEGGRTSSSCSVVMSASDFCSTLVDVEPAPSGWSAVWQTAEQVAQQTIEAQLAGEMLSEPAVARALARHLDHRSNLFAATSMPIRDIEAFSGAALGPHVYANRGASGMEGMVSTAAGIAVSTKQRTVGLIGDLSFLYDLNALWCLAGAAEPVDLTLVIIDNDGGGIFSTLPQLTALPGATFERVVATPHGVDIETVVKALGVEVQTVASAPALIPAVRQALDAGGLRVIYVKSNRRDNAELHRRLVDAVANALP